MDLDCTQCGGKVPIEPETDFLVCPFCNTSLFVELRGTVLHTIIRPTLDEKQAAESLTSHLIDREIQRPGQYGFRMIYLPFWQIEWPTRVQAVLADHPPELGMAEPELPSGSQIPARGDEAESKRFTAPIIQLDVALDLTRDQARSDEQYKSARLVHAPFYIIEYSIGSHSFSAFVDAATGAVYPTSLPTSLSTARTFKAMCMAGGMVAFASVVIIFSPSILLGLVALALLSVPLTFLYRLGIRR